MFTLINIFLRRIKDIFHKKNICAQLVEEGLLLSISLFVLAMLLGTVQNLNKSFTNFLNTVWNSLEDLATQLFGWLWGK